MSGEKIGESAQKRRSNGGERRLGIRVESRRNLIAHFGCNVGTSPHRGLLISSAGILHGLPYFACAIP
jgi:hypothetical protein